VQTICNVFGANVEHVQEIESKENVSQKTEGEVSIQENNKEGASEEDYYSHEEPEYFD
jgi:hypothetical protein